MYLVDLASATANTLALALIPVPPVPTPAPLVVTTLTRARVTFPHLWAGTRCIQSRADTLAIGRVNNLVFLALQIPWTLTTT